MNYNEIDVMVLNETDINSKRSRFIRTNPVEDNMIRTYLNLEDYNLWIPDQWAHEYGQARTLIYMRKHLVVKQQTLSGRYRDLPIVILEVGLEGTKKTKVCGTYCEHTGRVSSLKTPESRMERMERTLELWKEIAKEDNYLILGDINVDWNRVNDPDYYNKNIARKIYDFVLTESSNQVTEEFMRDERSQSKWSSEPK